MSVIVTFFRRTVMCRKIIYSVSFILVLVLVCGVGRADVTVAEDLLVDLRAEDLPYGEGVTTWTNHGSLGDFTANGSPLVEDVAGMKTVTFDGGSWFDGPASTPGIEGGGTRTIEVWAYNPSIPSEETIVSWAQRGGPDGTNMAFNYGNSDLFGAVGHWGGADMGWWGTHSPAPAANTWWLLTYTHDGTATRLYVNGEEESVRDPVSLDTYGGNPIRVAAQADGTGAGVESAFNFTGSIAAVRIHDGVLSPADSLTMHLLEKVGRKLGFKVYVKKHIPRALVYKENSKKVIMLVRQEDVEKGWAMYGMTRAVWMMEPAYRKEKTGSAEHNTTSIEEGDCLINLLAAYAIAKAEKKDMREPALDRLKKIMENGETIPFINLEIFGLKVPHFSALYLDEKEKKEVKDYIQKYVLLQDAGS